MAGHIGQQYKRVSPDRVPKEEFRRSPTPEIKKGRRNFPAAFRIWQSSIDESANSAYSPSPFIISIMC